MSARTTWADRGAGAAQLRRDPRTLALLLVVPCVLMVILRYAFDGQPEHLPAHRPRRCSG